MLIFRYWRLDEPTRLAAPPGWVREDQEADVSERDQHPAEHRVLHERQGRHLRHVQV